MVKVESTDAKIDFGMKQMRYVVDSRFIEDYEYQNEKVKNLPYELVGNESIRQAIDQLVEEGKTSLVTLVSHDMKYCNCLYEAIEEALYKQGLDIMNLYKCLKENNIMFSTEKLVRRDRVSHYVYRGLKTVMYY